MRFLALLAACAVVASIEAVDPCKRQPFRGRCPSKNGESPKRSQFVLRYYMRNGECVSYPYGHCANDDSEPQLYRYKEECEDACINPPPAPLKLCISFILHELLIFSCMFLFSPQAPLKSTTVEETTSTTTTPSTSTSEAPTTSKEAPTTTTTPVVPTTETSSTTIEDITANKKTTMTTMETAPTTPRMTTTTTKTSTTTTTTVEPTSTQSTTIRRNIHVKTTERLSVVQADNTSRSVSSQSPATTGEYFHFSRAFLFFCIFQCEPDGRQCFCVDAKGIEIANSRTRNGQKPDCDGIQLSSAPKTKECVGGAARGPCSAALTRWYYDEQEAKCKRFTFSGCGGNGNNYDTEEACIRRCAPPPMGLPKCEKGEPLKTKLGVPVNCAKSDCPYGYKCSVVQQTSVCCPENNKIIGLQTSGSADVCSLPKERGPCDKYELRFYYNAELKECKYFFWGGCQGNKNNFEKVEDCEATCGINQRLPFRTTQGIRITPGNLSKNDDGSVVERYVYMVSILLPVNRCLHPKDPGTCRGQFIRWYWDNERKTCDVFTYTGCQGNGNNYASREECLAICHKEATPVVAHDFSNVCKHDVDAGECNGVFQRFAFDTESGECRPFTYGGCGGNGNNFATLAECRIKCQKVALSPGNLCEHDIEVGECSGVFVRFGYDKSTNDCRQFTYGGCGGNGNNFATIQECRNVCIRKVCNPNPQCDLTRCQIVNDRNGCPFCSCPPTSQPSPPGTLISSVLSLCPEVNVDTCKEPCIIINNRKGCKDCVCPSLSGSIGQPPASFEDQDASPIAPSTSRPVTPTVPPTSVGPPSGPTPNRSSPPGTITGHIPRRQGNIMLEYGFLFMHPMLQEPGPCKHFVDRWFFNGEDGTCHPFKYGGCAGNRNHFFSQNECEIHCARFLPTTGKQLSAEPSTSQTQTTLTSTVTAAPVGVPTEREEIDARVLCSLPPDAGPCFEYVPRWFFNAQSGQCEQFSYGSCGGNENNFADRSVCEIKCLRAHSTLLSHVPERCTYERDGGSGKGYNVKWYFNMKNLRCEQFVYEGRGGNQNQFETLSDCERYCSRKLLYQSTSNFEPPRTLNLGHPNMSLHQRLQRFAHQHLTEGEESRKDLLSCPNGLKELRYADGRPVMCLPGKNQCPEKSVCYFNGVDFFCCPNEEDPYDKHVFGGYDGEETKHGYKVFGPLNIRRLMDEVPLRALRRQASSNAFTAIDSITAPLRFDEEKPRTVSRAQRMRSNPSPPHHGNPICIEPLATGDCGAAHLRYYYDRDSDKCRLFYYTGCKGNNNNFGSMIDCQRLCVLGGQSELLFFFNCRFIVQTLTLIAGPRPESDASTPPPCPDGKSPLGGSAPVLCGNTTDSIGCPTGFFCLHGPPDICCPNGEVKRKVSLNFSAHSRNVLLSTPKYMCPDASDPLMASNGEPTNCGAGFDGMKLCPKGFYCAIDVEKQCAPLKSPGRFFFLVSMLETTTSVFAEESEEFEDGEDEEDEEEGMAHLMLKPAENTTPATSTALPESEDHHIIDLPTEPPTVEEVHPVKTAEDKSVCQIKPSEGRACREDEKPPRTNLHYFYSPKDRRCKLYFFRGCGGNANRFEKKADCERLCLS
ncbi:unnamed protein product [Haemonchus placei]|uniref:Kunitz/Bovine pancreatic trypsin inhibitor domain protein n=1 Tax=Haemonchus placei TaxID=6290 RepID=A0A158QLA8_HAEPC|nr:unnamed protein product [Haemonchus placei]